MTTPTGAGAGPEGLLLRLEASRIATVTRANKVAASVAGGGLLIGGGLMWWIHPIAGLFPLVLALLVAGFIRYRMTSAYAHEFSRSVINAILDQIQPGLDYHHDHGLNKDVFNQTRLFSKPDRYSSSNLFQGNVGATQIRFARVVAESESKSDEGRTYSDIFRGLLFQADFHKHFKGRTRVMPDVMERFGGRFGKRLQGLRPGMSEQLVHLEDPDFEASFKVVSTDQVEARYLLTPAMQQRLSHLERRWSSDIWLCFQQSHVVVAIKQTEPMFDVSTSTPATDRAQFERLKGEIELCCSIVDDLDLNTRIWTKE